MTSRLAAIAIDALEPRRIAGFWCEVLGWQVIEEDDEVVTIAAADGSWPSIDVVQVPEGNEFCLLLRTVEEALRPQPPTT